MPSARTFLQVHTISEQVNITTTNPANPVSMRLYPATPPVNIASIQ